TKDAVVRFYGVDPRKVHVVLPGVGGPFRPGLPDDRSDAEHAAALVRSTDPYLLYVGKLTPRRNVIPLLEVFAGLRGRFPSLRLVLVGPNTGGFDLPEIADRLAVRGRIHHVEHLEQDQL